MTMIDRAARAMYDTVQPEWSWEDPEAELLRQMYKENARAAIQAIRNPSQAMEQAGSNALECDRNAARAWQAMIDICLATAV